MKHLLLLFLALSISLLAKAQHEWEIEAAKPGANFFTIREKMTKKLLGERKEETQPTATPDIEEVDGKLSKFRRWEWYWSSRVNPDGTFPSIRHKLNEIEKIKAKKASTAGKPTDFNATWTNISRTFNSNPGYSAMGRTANMAFHPTNPNIFWVAANHGGIWKTIDNGATYTPLGDNLPYLGVDAIVVDQTNPNIIYLSSSDQFFYKSSLGVYKSIDGGLTWNITGLNNTFTDGITIHELVQSKTNNNVLFAACSNGLFKTSNGGTTWALIRSGEHTDVKIHVTNDSTIFTVDAAGIYRSTDNGSTFTQQLNQTNVKKLAVTKANSSKLIAWCSYCSSYNYWVSANGGNTWTMQTASQIFPVMAISPLNDNILYGGGVDMYKSTNGGTSWSQISQWFNGGPIPTVHADHRKLVYNPLTNLIYSCNDGGITEYNESTGTWTNKSNNLVITEFYHAASSATDPNIIGAGSQDNGGVRRGSNLTWFDTNGGDAGTQAISPANPNISFSNYNPEPALIRTLDGWSTATNVQPTDAVTSWWILPYVLDPNNASTLYAGYQAVYKSINLGTTWTRISPNFTPLPGPWYDNLRSIAVAPSNSNVIYAAHSNKFYATQNGGTSWSTYTFSNLPGMAGYYQGITAICVKSTDANTVFVTVGGLMDTVKVYKSTNGGTTWTNFSTGLPNVGANTMVYQSGAHEVMYIGTDLGVYYRDTTMTSWDSYGAAGFPNVPVTSLHIQNSSSKLRAATYGRGMYETNLLLVPLPIELSNFNVKSQNETALLYWTTATELNSDYFDIEHSVDGRTWLKLGSINAAGQSNAELKYSYTDKKPVDGENLYRLNMVEKNGKSNYSPVRSITFDHKAKLTLWPNPANETIHLSLSNLSGIKSIKVMNLAGRLIQEVQPSVNIDVRNLPVGMYIIAVTSTNGVINEHKVVINH
jgi:hypothetical protein